MKNKKIKIIGIIAIILVILALIIIPINKSGFFNLKNQNSKYIKIGFVSSLSGDAGVWGQDVKNGFDFAVQEINAQGGINGKLIQPIYQDDKCNAKDGVNAFENEIQLDNVKIITGTVCSSVALSVAPITQKNGILYMATGATNPEVTKQGDLIFRLWISDAYEAKAVSEYFTKDLGFKKLAIMTINDNPAGVAIKDVFTKTTIKNNAKITDTEQFSSNKNSFQTIITKLINTNPQGIYIMSNPNQLATIINQLHTLRYKGIIFAYGPAMLTKGISDKIKDKTNVYYADAITTKQTNFWKDYKQIGRAHV